MTNADYLTWIDETLVKLNQTPSRVLS